MQSQKTSKGKKMKSQITLKKIKAIWAQHDVDMSESDFVLVLDQCNAQSGMNNRSAEDWAVFFARQDAAEQRANDAEMRQFHSDAYGDD